MPAAAVGLVGTALAYSQAEDAKSAAKQAADEQNRQAERANAESKRQYEEQQAIYKPIRDRLISEGMADTPIEYQRYADTVRQKFAPAMRQTMSGPLQNSGMAASSLQAAQMNQTQGLRAAYQQAKEQQRGILMSLLGHDQSVGLGQNYVNSMNGMANLYGRNAAMLGQAANANSANAAKGLSAFGTALGDYYGKPQKQEAGKPEQASEVEGVEPKDYGPYLPGATLQDAPKDMIRQPEPPAYQPPVFGAGGDYGNAFKSEPSDYSSWLKRGM